MLIKINPFKEILNEGEKRFAEVMLSKGYSLFYQPFVKDDTARYKKHHFDFFCLDTGIFYEVIAHPGAYNSSDYEIEAWIEDGYPVQIVTPEGEIYIHQHRKWRS